MVLSLYPGILNIIDSYIYISHSLQVIGLCSILFYIKMIEKISFFVFKNSIYILLGDDGFKCVFKIIN